MIDEKEILKKITKVEIYTRFLADHFFAGRYSSSFKGRGIEFANVRPYVFGDDVKTIDWNITARMNYPFVKEFVEERQLSILFLVDLSPSMLFGTGEKTKREFVTEIVALLSWTAIRNNDKVGVAFFTDRVEKYIPPRKGRFHILRIIRELLYFNPSEEGSSVSSALEFASRVSKKRSVVFCISDFLNAQNIEKNLRILRHNHDVIGIRVLDPKEEILPDCGLCEIADTETQETLLLNLSSYSTKKAWEKYAKEDEERIKKTFARASCDYLKMDVEKDYIAELLKFFKLRAMRR